MYNTIPRMLDGLTSLEMITSCKVDHKDLAYTHVWGCPCYILDPVLQNNKTIPKWNCRTRMGQFLGFSCFHSSTVALVQNLHRGHDSHQYHVVFGDTFEAVFNERKTNEEIDKFCETLLKGNCEYYVEDEHDQDGMLI